MEAMLATQGRQPVANGAAPAKPVVGLPVGSVAPAFELPSINGDKVSLQSLRSAGKPVLLIMSDPHCGPCNALLPEIGRWERDHGSNLTVAVVSRGDPEANPAKAVERTLSNVLIQEDREVAKSYGTTGTPSGVLVSADGKIAAETASGAEAIRQLVVRATGSPPVAINANTPSAPKLKAGDTAPEIELPDLEGKTVRLSEYQERETLVLFWNPGCGFCQRMLPELREWISTRQPDAPELLVVSRGQEEENRAQGIDAPILLDQGFATGRSYGATGTPNAVLIGAGGMVASPVVAGAPAVMTLARGGASSSSNGNAPANTAKLG